MGSTDYLLDTHALIWALTEPRKLSAKARRIVQSLDHRLLASAATAYELAYKHRLGKLPGLDGLLLGYPRHIAELCDEELSIRSNHALAAGQLEWDHRDPFDRLIAAQAIVESLVIITADQALQDFGLVETLW
ncbi:type II toxin-antitoxin system VapC family toxin [Arthrobacter cupressi]|uniref:PIN domain nuclease, a component of toxin-antitoxin system (PIN domain) n=1 Tax=Arthrobacter cupressi TaxID=1045773 RepID=A0A1G8LQX1_9MICC|nr:type II toxin-antitoxin system VapC family toxin [Arthrobacter cupressi]NYD77545.1 PIN domain nuclease of toxin-antitoxin system [Arthrobacter cupressi]SDI58084.1 PIN domain nuclease, a component of toxin-antitoxin system (PIN domain) [Arthrobacter cupressi]